MRKAQSTLEYAIIFAILVAALLSMAAYIKRSIQGQFRGSADQLGEQYAPRDTSSDILFRIYGEELSNTQTQESGEDLISTTDFYSGEYSEESGWEQVNPP